MTLSISVTAADIAAGKPDRPESCAIACALRRITGVPNIHVEEAELMYIGQEKYCVTSVDDMMKVDRFIKAFDARKPVSPIAFEIDLK